MKVVFAHGKESGPWGTKIRALAGVAQERGHDVASPDFTGSEDPDARVGRLLAEIGGQNGSLVFVGSSMGGYVVTVASQALRPAGLFLMAPAFYLPGYSEQDPHPNADKTSILHGWNDAVVPPDHAIRFARRHQVELHLLNAGHALAERLSAVERLFAQFLDELGDHPLKC
jgi:pimeloyl-ACP methyl ester carboxylesterase